MSERSASSSPLPEEIIEAMRAPVHGSAAGRARVMSRVRAEARRHRWHVVSWRGWGARRGLTTPLALAAAAVVGFLLVGGTRFPSLMDRLGGGRAWSAGVIDTASLLPATVAMPVPAQPAVRVLVEPIAAGIRDTLRLVRLVLDAPAAARVALTARMRGADARDAERTLAPVDSGHDARGRWSAVVRVPRDLDHLSLLVDGRQRVAIPASALTASHASRVSGDSL